MLVVLMVEEKEGGDGQGISRPTGSIPDAEEKWKRVESKKIRLIRYYSALSYFVDFRGHSWREQKHFAIAGKEKEHGKIYQRESMGMEPNNSLLA